MIKVKFKIKSQDGNNIHRFDSIITHSCACEKIINFVL